jgi:TfoX/Sxy family transcriptional regulator of competence genes
MASDQSFADYVADQLSGAGRVRLRRMFGEFGVWCDEKTVALVCDNQLYVKPTDAGRRFIGRPVEAPPYPGARSYFLVDSGLDDRDWLSELVRLTAAELPAPRPKLPKEPRPPGAAKARGKAAPAKKPARAAAKKPRRAR